MEFSTLLGHFRRPGPAGETVDIEVSATGAGTTAFRRVIPRPVTGRSSLGVTSHRGMSYARFPPGTTSHPGIVTRSSLGVDGSNDGGPVPVLWSGQNWRSGRTDA